MSVASARNGTQGAFSAAGDRWEFAGTLTFDAAAEILAAAERLPLPESGVVDLAGLAHADSAALAVLLALRRRAVAEERPLAFAAMPALVATLADVYGIEELLGARA
jgi:phospholipid transport system transporter-binding protein